VTDLAFMAVLEVGSFVNTLEKTSNIKQTSNKQQTNNSQTTNKQTNNQQATSKQQTISGRQVADIHVSFIFPVPPLFSRRGVGEGKRERGEREREIENELTWTEPELLLRRGHRCLISFVVFFLSV
jgi:hypothetical protein